MKLLFDQNLPRRLVREVSDVFPGSSHVALLALATATDAEIFAYARDNRFTIVSKDNDFRQLSFYYGAPRIQGLNATVAVYSSGERKPKRFQGRVFSLYSTIAISSSEINA